MSELHQLQVWLRDRALPLWAERGFDRETGRFQERLSLDAEPIRLVPIRSMVQARQIYVFAHAEKLGWLPGGGKLAEMAMTSLLRDFCSRSGGRASFAFSIASDGRVMSPVRDAYAHAFLLFAIAWLHALNSDRALVGLADEVTAFMDEHLLDRVHGGLHDQSPSEPGSGKRQNPQMHLLEAYLALERSMPGRGFLERAAPIVQLFRDKMFDEQHGVLLEHFAADWSAHPDPAKRDIFEPGHHFEWVWLLREYQDATGDDQSHWIEQLYRSALRFGLAPGCLVVDEVRASGTVYRPSHRIWPHTEGLKAAAVYHRRGDGEARSLAEGLSVSLASVFLGRPFEGGWIDHVTPNREPLVDYVPASTLYHVVLALFEAAAAFGEGGPA